MELFERPTGGEKALLVHLDLPRERDREDLDEFRDLADSAGADVCGAVVSSRHTPEPRFFVGSGKAQEIADRVLAEGVELVLFNHDLSPSQERNLEALLKCRVLDRTGLILDIFAQRARSFEGQLQVELAQLRHLASRLVRGWTHLERQKGGIGLRGPGETQLETDRRLIGQRIKQLNRRLEKVQRQRFESRKSRSRAEVPTVALVGYTNAGKSTLFNRRTASGVYAADQLFATLDPTMRRAELPDGRRLVLADTVGFIRHLPHDLVAAFHATLEEAREADLVVHVVDASSEDRDERIREVESVLGEIGAQETPRIELFNKIDRLDVGPRVDRDDEGEIRRVWLSAATGEGLELFDDTLAEFFRQQTVHARLRLPPSGGRLRSLLFAEGAVINEDIDEQGRFLLEIDMPEVRYRQLCSREPALAEYVR